MKKNCWPTRIFALLVLCAALSTTAALGAEAGSPQDPLVTLSYLNDTFLNTVLTRVDEKIALRNSQLPQGGGGSFTRSEERRVGRLLHRLRLLCLLYGGHPFRGTNPDRGHRLRGDAAGRLRRVRLPLLPGPD